MTIEILVDGEVVLEQRFNRKTYSKSLNIIKARCRNFSISGRKVGWRFKGLKSVHYV
jgi:hypothetical protein